jgi:hypothetical protein
MDTVIPLWDLLGINLPACQWCARPGFKLWAESSWARLGQAKPSPGLTGLWAWPEMFESPKPSAQAEALVVFFWELLEDGRYILNQGCYFQMYFHTREGNWLKLIRETVRRWCSCTSPLLIWLFPFSEFAILYGWPFTSLTICTPI